MSPFGLLFSFRGRIPRSTFLYYEIVYWALTLGLAWLDARLAADPALLGLRCVLMIFLLGLLYTNLAVWVKRAHDLRHSGWWVLLSLFPNVGPVMFFELAYLKGRAEANY